jgi:DNA polymerase-1
MNPSTLTALVDADIVVYQAAAVSEQSVDFDDGDGPTTILNMDRAKETVIKTLTTYRKAVRAKDMRLCLTDRSSAKATFRYKVLPSYKGQRPNSKPALHDELLDWMKDEYKHILYPGLEGDDVMGILASGEGRSRLVIVSIDKDMTTVPCRLWVPGKGQEKPRLISHEEADRNWMIQTLTGDTVDNYKGAPGIGPVKARQALAGACGLEEMWSVVLGTFEIALPKQPPAEVETYAIQQARLARILRHEDYDADTGRVRLWHPTEPEWVDAAS